MQERYYPLNAKLENSDNPAIRIYGNRIHADQSLYEYLIEFLLVFSSPKKADGEGAMQFHDSEALNYYVNPRNGFRRFVFYEQAKKTKKVPADKQAYEDIFDILTKHVDADKESDKRMFLLAVQDLFRGYAAVLKKRSWCAQSLLPLCPEMIFCEEMPNDNFRSKGVPDGWLGKPNKPVSNGCDIENTFYDVSFDLTRHNFLARGGEVYYLHLLQAIKNEPKKKKQLQALLYNLLTEKSGDFSELANWIQTTWERERKLDHDLLIHEMNMGYIPYGAYIRSGRFAVEELTSYLSNRLHPVHRIELMAKGVMLQILRMQIDRTEEYLGIDRLPCIIDMRRNADRTIKQMSMESLNKVTEAFVSAINKYITENRQSEEVELTDEYKLFTRARRESLDVFKNKGKEIQCIIPSNGPSERFSLSEDIVKFLVLSLVPAGEKMSLDRFLEKLYDHYAFVIGPVEYKRCLRDDNMDVELTNSYNKNKDAFQQFLKDAGFLRDLSDATSIVVNPYKEVVLA